MISVPNIAHLWIRISLLLGHFDYASRGILDHTHLRFYTRRSLLALLATAGLRISELAVAPVPLPLLVPERLHGPWLSVIHMLSAFAARVWKTGLAYQFIAFCRTRPSSSRSTVALVRPYGERIREKGRSDMTGPKVIVVMPAYNAGRERSA